MTRVITSCNPEDVIMTKQKRSSCCVINHKKLLSMKFIQSHRYIDAILNDERISYDDIYYCEASNVRDIVFKQCDLPNLKTLICTPHSSDVNKIIKYYPQLEQLIITKP